MILEELSSDPRLPSQESRKVDTTTRTFRLDEDVERGLEELSLRENVSVNVLANRALRKHIEWDALAEKFGFMAFQSTFMIKMIQYLTEEEVREMGRWTSKNLAQETAQYWFKRVDLPTAVKTIERLGQYGNRFRLDTSSNGPRFSMVLKHDMGVKWSIYYEEAIVGWLKGMLGQEGEVTSEITENQVNLDILLKSLGTTASRRAVQS